MQEGEGGGGGGAGHGKRNEVKRKYIARGKTKDTTCECTRTPQTPVSPLAYSSSFFMVVMLPCVLLSSVPSLYLGSRSKGNVAKGAPCNKTDLSEGYADRLSNCALKDRELSQLLNRSSFT